MIVVVLVVVIVIVIVVVIVVVLVIVITGYERWRNLPVCKVIKSGALST